MSVFTNIINSVVSVVTDVQKQQNGWNTKLAESNAKQITQEEVFEQLGNKEWSIPRKLVFPVKRDPVVVTSPFGIRYLQGVKQMHIGVDFKTIDSRTVRAVEDGIIKKVLAVDKDYPCRFKWDGKLWVPSGAPKDRAWTPYVVLIGNRICNFY
jgi:murein DD-endopeptidase MepM/ murein hydrolase activator NlpD